MTRVTRVLISLATVGVLGALGIERASAEPPGAVLRTFWVSQAGDSLGYGLAAVGNLVAAGAPYHPNPVASSGAVRLFDSQTGQLVRTILNPSPHVQSFFGESVAAVGDLVAVAAPEDDTRADCAGAVYLVDPSTGACLRTFYDPRLQSYCLFGQSVAVSGSSMLVGGPGGFDGSVYLFNTDTGSLLRTFVRPPDPEPDGFGDAVALTQNRALIGATYDHTGADYTGSAYLFDTQTGQLLRKFLNPTPEYCEYFGQCVAFAGENVLIGAPNAKRGPVEASGAVYLFDGQTGDLLLTLENPHPQSFSWFGCALAISGDYLYVGAPGATSESGVVYVFDPTTGDLVLEIPNPALPGSAGDLFGLRLAMLGSNLLVAGPDDDIGGVSSGVVYLIQGVPEPATLALMALGAVAVLGQRRRWRRG